MKKLKNYRHIPQTNVKKNFLSTFTSTSINLQFKTGDYINGISKPTKFSKTKKEKNTATLMLVTQLSVSNSNQTAEVGFQ